MSELPGELVEEILCRVPAKSLKRLRSTCKPWNGLFNDDDDHRRFAEKHSDKAAKQFLGLMLTKSFRICPLSVSLHGGITIPSRGLSLADPRSRYSSQFDISRVFHCDGLLLCIPEDESRIVVWNPCTGHTRWIKAAANRHEKGRDFVLGYYHQNGNKRYKVLSFYRYKQDSEIYEFESDSWRTLENGFRAGWSLGLCDQSVSLKGKTYMFARNATLGQSLLRFDFATEKSQPLPLPYHRPRYETAVLSVFREEKLSVLLQRRVTEIWVTNKIDDETNLVSWTKVLALDLTPDLRIPDHGSFLLDEDKKAVMFCQRWIDPDDESSSTDKVYIVGEDNTTVAQEDFGADAEDNGCWPAILNYVPSLAQIKRARRKRTRSDYRTTT